MDLATPQSLRPAWKKENYSCLLPIIVRECALLGLNSPSVSKT